ncbi:HdeD family acid-resistance protein [Algibacter mikhailovii]|uniref:HdeD family acid-resistance protein n=1 Tax=Algibacter mikhailovii TaxID=425498 RepID=A0A918R1X2_9FLAO|nr:DUF308 domain-containing protein [Algibacter mikhailovii]GGZ84188.1 hypothetical protein GCM10007028_22540 [Algibacter mikhailovii]
MKTLNKYWWLTLIRGIVLIILAILIFRHPLGALVGLAIYLSVSLLFIGITQVFMSFAVKDTQENWGWTLAVGLIDIFIAFILLSNPAVTAATLPFIVGFWLIVAGVMNFVSAFQDKKEGVPYWWLGLIGGLFTIFIGFVLTNNLLAGTLAITYWIGFGVMLAGIVNIGLAIGLKSLKKEIERAEEV